MFEDFRINEAPIEHWDLLCFLTAAHLIQMRNKNIFVKQGDHVRGVSRELEWGRVGWRTGVMDTVATEAHPPLRKWFWRRFFDDQGQGGDGVAVDGTCVRKSVLLHTTRAADTEAHDT